VILRLKIAHRAAFQLVFLGETRKNVGELLPAGDEQGQITGRDSEGIL